MPRVMPGQHPYYSVEAAAASAAAAEAAARGGRHPPAAWAERGRPVRCLGMQRLLFFPPLVLGPTASPVLVVLLCMCGSYSCHSAVFLWLLLFLSSLLLISMAGGAGFEGRV